MPRPDSEAPTSRAAADPALWLLALAAAVMLLAYAGVCWIAGSAWPWGEVAHEDGERTLLATVFYFEHAARELWLDLVLAGAVAGAALGARRVDPARATRARAKLFGAGALAALALILGGTFAGGGVAALVENLGQMPTRAGEPPVWGAHWRYHALSRLALLLGASALAVTVARIGRAAPPDADAGRAAWRGTWLAFAFGTVIFVPTLEPFRDPRFLGHQARELFTHALVTVPLALGVTLRALGSDAFGQATLAKLPWTTALATVLIGVYLAAGTLLTDSVSQGQSEDLRVLLIPHFFEHALGYLLVPCAAAWLALVLSLRSGRAGPSRPSS